MKHLLPALLAAMALPAFADELANVSDASAQRIATPYGVAYVFTNVNSVATFSPKVPLRVNRALVVGGGGAGGGVIGGGGGGGGVVDFTPASAMVLQAGSTVTAHAGLGGIAVADSWGQGGSGYRSFLDFGTTNLVALGGGGGGGYSVPSGVTGGCGGGSSNANATQAPGSQGGSGGANPEGIDSVPGGGGGAGGDGQDGYLDTDGVYHAGNGGIGYLCDITGEDVYYAGGGGGGGGNKAKFGGEGGLGGGGRGFDNGSLLDGENGVNGLGGGGGGCSWGNAAPYFGGFGGSGVVILSVTPVSSGDGPVVEAVAKGVSPSEISISAELLCAGAGAESVDLYFSVAPAGMAFLSSSVVKSQWKTGDEAWSYSLSNLGPEAVYEYRLAATNDQGVGMAEITGTVSSWPSAVSAIAVSSTDPAFECVPGPYGTALVFTNASAGVVTLSAMTDLLITRAFIVGGGGAGGSVIGGGGGGGGVVDYRPATPVEFIHGESLTLTVGAGGLGRGDWGAGQSGGNSRLALPAETLTAFGGGGGGGFSVPNPIAGGCGGGAAHSVTTPAAGSQGGNGGIAGTVGGSGGCPGGGGGAGGDGIDGSLDDSLAGTGGVGYPCDIFGDVVYYAGGGGGGGGNEGLLGALGGPGGGGRSYNNASMPGGNAHAEPGVDGLGGGGGGQCWGNDIPNGGNGGCGTVIVVVRQPSSPVPVVTVSSATLSENSVSVSANVDNVGDGAESVDLYLAFGPTGKTLPEPVLVAHGLSTFGSWSTNIADLSTASIFDFAVTAVNTVSERTVVEGHVWTTIANIPEGVECEQTWSPDGIAFKFFDPADGETAFSPIRPMVFKRALVVGGGGAGGWTIGGGGGGGQVVEYAPASEISISPSDSIAFSIGAGGSNKSDVTGWPQGGDGLATTLSIAGSTISAVGGGGGGSWNSHGGRTGASGGGAACGEGSHAVGTHGGNGGAANGHRPGGGGGAGGDGGDGDGIETAGNGGDGVSSDITGSVRYYGGGGGGGAGNDSHVAGRGGLGGGGDGGAYNSGLPGFDGEPGTGGGGGGGSYSPDRPGGNGGSGAVIVLLSPAKIGSAPVLSTTSQATGMSTATATTVMTSVGEDSSTADFYFAIAPEGEPLPSPVQVARGVGDLGSWSTNLADLVFGQPYTYEVVAVNDAGVSGSVTGTVSTAGAAMEVFVSPDGIDAPGRGTEEAPFRTVTHALYMLNRAAGGVARVAPGLYDIAAGEAFPLVPGGATIIGPASGDDLAVLDAGNAAEHVLVATNVSSEISGLMLRNSTSSCIDEFNATVAATNCVFTQSFEDCTQHTWFTGNYGALSCVGGEVELVGCVMTNMARYAVIYYGGGVPSVTLRDCLVADNRSAHSAITSFCQEADSGANLRMYGTTFRNNSCLRQGCHVLSYCAVAYLTTQRKDCVFEADRCQFLGNNGGNLIGFSGYLPRPDNPRFSNSLFAGNDTAHNMIQGYQDTLDIYNCTFIGNVGGYAGNALATTLHDSILVGERYLSFAPGGGYAGNTAGLVFENCIVWNCGVGTGYSEIDSTVVSSDPRLGNVSVAWNAEGFDPRPRPYSPAIDAGRGRAWAADATDLDGNARVADNDGDSVAVADLGAFESLFGATVSPTFQIPVPGALYGFKGGTVTVPVTISPAASGPVTASVSYSEGIAGPAELVFENGAGPVDLEVYIGTGSDDEFYTFVISESGSSLDVAPLSVDVFTFDPVVNVGHETVIYVPVGETVEIPVAIEGEGITASTAIEITTATPTGSGSNTIAWKGSSVIAAGASVTAGALSITGGDGVNSVTLRVDGGFTFAETEADTVTIGVVGYPGFVYVDPVAGNDATVGAGTLSSPFATIGAAIGKIADGDEIRLLPGTYGSAETFPLAPENRAIAGHTGNGPADRASVVVSGGNTADTLFVYGPNAVKPSLANLSLRDTTSSVISADASSLAISDVEFTQSGANLNVPGAVVMKNNASIAATNCVFSGMTRLAAVYIDHAARDDANTFIASRCSFIGNESQYGAIATYQDWTTYPSAIVRLSDCLFQGNSVSEPDTKYCNVNPGTIAFIRYGGELTVDRCRFFGNEGAAMFAAQGIAIIDIRDSLFSGNENPYCFAIGGNSHMNIRNCTFVDDDCGFNGMGTYLHNSIVVGGTMGFLQPDGVNPNGDIRCYAVILRGVEDGTGYNVGGSSNVSTDDPKLKNISVAWDDPEFDARLAKDSPAIDAGVNDWVLTSLDLDGTARLKPGLSASAAPVVDLGCYERQFLSPGTVIMVK